MTHTVKFYLSAPMSGIERNMVEQTFAQMASAVHAYCKRHSIEDWEVVDPSKANDPDTQWADAVIRDLELLRDCDIIVMHRDWQISVGCAIERAFAQKAGITIEMVDEL